MAKIRLGEVALVTGGSRGMGAASAAGLPDQGADVAISYAASAGKADAVVAARRFEYLPVSLFGAVMGLTGLSLAWHLAAQNYHAPLWVSDFIGATAVAAFVAIGIAYLLKLVTAPDAVRAEFKHPIAGNLFGTIPVSLLLLPMVLVQVSLGLAQVVWVIGAVTMAGFAWLIVSRWMSDRQQLAHATPAWIIPVVGMLDMPLALPVLHLPGLHGVMVLGLAVGLFFAVPLFTIIFNRLVFEAPMPDAMLPSLLILVAPFAVGFSAYVATAGETDLFAQSLYALTLFLLTVLLGRLRNLLACCPFRVSWWAVSFPLAAAAVMALHFARGQPTLFTNTVAIMLLGFATLVIVGLSARTVHGIIKGELRTLSG
jgi:tellurite resistance protein